MGDRIKADVHSDTTHSSDDDFLPDQLNMSVRCVKKAEEIEGL